MNTKEEEGADIQYVIFFMSLKKIECSNAKFILILMVFFSYYYYFSRIRAAAPSC